jgi:diguanylate cyclase (GGDEF)-like protein/PAS domain S-box-containing protein
MLNVNTADNRPLFDIAQAGWGMSLIEKATNLFMICVGDEIAYVNPAGQSLLKSANVDQVIGKPLLDFIHSDYKDFLAFGLDVLAEEEDAIPLKLCTLCNEALDVKLLISELSLNGNVVFVIEAQDITAYKKASEAVQEREHRMKSILNTVSEGILTFTHEGIIQTANPALEKVFGHPAKILIGNHVEFLFDANVAARYRKIFEKRLSDGKSSLMGNTVQLKGLDATKTTFPLEMTLSSIQIGNERVFTAVIRDITEQVENVERIQHMANHDALTGLPNRQLFTDRLMHATKLAKRNDKPLVLMFVDLDKFKPINDTLGHDAGDVVLIEIAKRFKSLIREADTVARIGGDEFVILLEEIDTPQSANIVAQKILDSFQEPILAAGQKCYLGASIGMAAFPDHSVNPDELMRMADEAMYAVKTHGRNNYRMYDFGLSVLGG